MLVVHNNRTDNTMHITTRIAVALGSVAVAGFCGIAPAAADTSVTVNVGSGNSFSLFNGNGNGNFKGNLNGNLKGNLNGNLKGNLNGNLNHNRLFNGNFRLSRLVHHKAS